jgi:hypothetical protein
VVFECGNQVKECGWKKGKDCVALKKEKECGCVRLVSACLFGRKVKQSRFPKMVCCEVGNCVSEHIPEAWLTADKFVHLDNGSTLGGCYGKADPCTEPAVNIFMTTLLSESSWVPPFSTYLCHVVEFQSINTI